MQAREEIPTDWLHASRDQSCRDTRLRGLDVKDLVVLLNKYLVKLPIYIIDLYSCLYYFHISFLGPYLVLIWYFFSNVSRESGYVLACTSFCRTRLWLVAQSKVESMPACIYIRGRCSL